MHDSDGIDQLETVLSRNRALITIKRLDQKEENSHHGLEDCPTFSFTPACVPITLDEAALGQPYCQTQQVAIHPSNVRQNMGYFLYFTGSKLSDWVYIVCVLLLPFVRSAPWGAIQGKATWTHQSTQMESCSMSTRKFHHLSASSFLSPYYLTFHLPLLLSREICNYVKWVLFAVQFDSLDDNVKFYRRRQCHR